MTKTTENIFSGKRSIIPLAEVNHIERDLREGCEGGITVITKGTTWNDDINTYNNNAYLIKDEAESFLNCWLKYREEIDSERKVSSKQKSCAISLPKITPEMVEDYYPWLICDDPVYGHSWNQAAVDFACLLKSACYGKG